MTVQQVANRLADYCRNEQFTQALEELYSEHAVSIEPFEFPGFDKETKGLEAMLEKDKKFGALVESRYGATVSQPLIAGNSFAFVLTMDMKMKGRDRELLTELCVYTVEDGKIISEQFFM
jgi:hypothetical protein